MSDAADLIDDVNRDVYVKIETDLLVVGDCIMTDRHHASGDNYEDNDPQNSIGGIIPSFPLSGWLRHGMEDIVKENGGTACHPGEANANFKRADEYDRDLDDGYHEKGSCTDDPHEDDGCVIFDLYGGFGGIPGKFMRRPIQFSPVRGNVDYTRGQAEGHYRRLNRNIVSRNDEDHRTPLRNTEIDAVANLDGSWHLSFRTVKPEFVALLNDSITHLNENQTEFMNQLGGARNFGAGIVDCKLINPLYDENQLNRVFDRAKGKDLEARRTQDMEELDEQWKEEYLPVFRDELTARIEAVE